MFSFVDNDAEKVFGIGLSRTATTSLHQALGILGLRSFHWMFKPENRILRLEDAYFCDAPHRHQCRLSFETLARMFPNAKFIYTTRPLDSWERSVVHHYGVPTPNHLKQRMRENAGDRCARAGTAETRIAVSRDPSRPLYRACELEGRLHRA